MQIPHFGANFVVHGPKSQLDAVRRFVYNQTWYQNHRYYADTEISSPALGGGEPYEVVRFLTGVDALRRQYQPELDRLYEAFHKSQENTEQKDGNFTYAYILRELQEKLPQKLLRQLDFREVTTARERLRNKDGMDVHPDARMYEADAFLKSAETQDLDLERGVFQPRQSQA